MIIDGSFPRSVMCMPRISTIAFRILSSIVNENLGATKSTSVAHQLEQQLLFPLKLDNNFIVGSVLMDLPKAFDPA